MIKLFHFASILLYMVIQSSVCFHGVGIVPFWSEIAELKELQNQGQEGGFSAHPNPRSRSRVSHRLYQRQMGNPLQDEQDNYPPYRRSLSYEDEDRMGAQPEMSDNYIMDEINSRANRRRAQNMNSLPNSRPRIAGGADAQQIVPWIVSLATKQNGGGGHFCSGAIIGPRTVLTSAYCWIDRYDNGKITWTKIDTVRVRYDGLDRFKLLISNQPTKYIVHPQFQYDWANFIRENNLAIVHLQDTIIETDRVKIIPIYDNEVNQNWQATLNGWAKTTPPGPGIDANDDAPAQLQSVQLVIKKKQVCDGIISPFPGINENEICGIGNGVNPCELDDGGPLVYYDKLVGIFASYSGKCEPGYPGIFQYLAFDVDWIRQNII